MQSRVLQSRHLQQAHRDEDGTVIVEMVNGAAYLYRGVPQDVFDTLLQVSSPGSYFHSKLAGRYSETVIKQGAKKGMRR